MKNEVLKAIAERRSIRAYTDECLTEDEIRTLMDVAMQSPSARNAQPWHFTFVTDQNVIESVNAASAKAMGRDSINIFYGAPLVVFISAEAEPFFPKLDCGIAVENLAIAAHAMGLGSVILGLPKAGFDSPDGAALKKTLEFPNGYDFMIAISIGHPAAGKDEHPMLEGRISRID